VKAKQPTIEVHDGDLPAGLAFPDSIGVDTETQGLSLQRDRLCLVQLTGGDGVCHLVRISADPAPAPNLKALFEDPSILKIFHYARFDVAMLKRWLDIDCAPVYCTKIASKLVRTYTDRHGLKDICRELLGVELAKEMQSSDWAAAEMSPQQAKYAAADVIYLHDLRAALDVMLVREGRTELAESCCRFLSHRTALDLQGWGDVDIFAH
jgi:ribonuclease D